MESVADPFHVWFFMLYAVLTNENLTLKLLSAYHC